MKVVADLHLHSRFSRAVSSQMVVPRIAEWAKKKGIDLVATGDWTHPVWFGELKVNLEETDCGLYKMKGQGKQTPAFLLSTEVSSIYSQGGETRRIHTLIFAPDFETVEKINKELTKRGVNLLSDGRPIMGLSAKALAELILEINEKCLIIPAHVWTPWFSLYGSKSGFDSIKECFGDLATSIYAIETGLSSDPAMNWRVGELTGRRIVSFSDAHSLQKLGREATVFEVEKLDYENVRGAIVSENQNTQRTRSIGVSGYQRIRGSESPDLQVSDSLVNRRSEFSEFSGSRILYTIEFYPEEGKYHYTGHRKCNVIYSPNETRKKGVTCPVCGKSLTVGVMSRVESLASQDIEVETETDGNGVQWVKASGPEGRRPGGTRVPYVMLVPLLEIISEAVSSGVGSQKVLTIYEQLINTFGSEFKTLLEAPIKEVERIAGDRVSEGIQKVRNGDIVIEPGYDGVFGKVKIWREEETSGVEEQVDQATLF